MDLVRASSLSSLGGVLPGHGQSGCIFYKVFEYVIFESCSSVLDRVEKLR